jgi:peptide/nickel transport system substrate-binding protein
LIRPVHAPLRWRRRGGAAALCVATLAAIGLSQVASATGANDRARAKAITGGVVKWAEPASTSPNFIFPYTPPAYFSVITIGNFIDLMFRPLYWPGQGQSVSIVPSLSLATIPTYSDGNKVLTFHMTRYRWSDGETVNAQDVMFWMNLMKIEYQNYGGWFPGGIPNDVKSVTEPNASTIQMTLTGPVNPHWYTYNNLPDITPLPMAWDITARGERAGAQACGKASYDQVAVKMVKGVPTPANALARDCVAVFDFLEQQSGYDPLNPKKANNSYSTYASNPLWQIVDGPFHLVSFNSTGYFAMKPNPSYSGPVKAKIAEFEGLPFTSDTAEFDALVGGKLTIGYIPVQDLTGTAESPTKPGPNNSRVASRFDLDPWNLFAFNYFPLNMNSVGDDGHAGTIFRQLYFRQAMQYAMDQPLYLKKLWRKYGVASYGPVPLLPKNSYSDKEELSNPYGYDPTKAVSLLSSNGWKVVRNGTDTCIDASKCGVPSGTPLSFSMVYATGNTAFDEYVAAYVASLRSIGINVSATGETFDTVLGTAFPRCSGSSCTWEIANWGGGWTYFPDFDPTGEEIFLPTAPSNAGSFSDTKLNQLMHGTDFGNTSIFSYENYAAKVLPVVYQPNATYQLTEVRRSLRGVGDFQNPFGLTLPEYLYFTK